MLKANDAAWPELFADVQALSSSRYVENPQHYPSFVASNDGSGLEFSALPRGDRLEVLSDADFWTHYEDLGLSDAQEVAIMNNILEGKPQEKWFDGVFDREAESLTFAQILEGIVADHGWHMYRQGRGGREM